MVGNGNERVGEGQREKKGTQKGIGKCNSGSGRVWGWRWVWEIERGKGEWEYWEVGVVGAKCQEEDCQATGYFLQQVYFAEISRRADRWHHVESHNARSISVKDIECLWKWCPLPTITSSTKAVRRRMLKMRYPNITRAIIICRLQWSEILFS